MDRTHELLTGEHMPKNFYMYMEMLEKKMIREEFVPKDVLDYRDLLNWEK